MRVGQKRRYQKYQQLLMVLFLTLVISPFLGEGIGDVLAVSLLLLTVVEIIREFTLSRRSRWLYAVIAILTLAVEVFTGLERFSPLGPHLSLLSQFIFVVYFSIAAYWIIRDIFQTSTVNADTIQGGVCVYLLLGLVWALLYGMVATFDPQAFSQKLIENESYLKTLYFSFTTLTTLGYGDIVPISKVAQVLTNLQALVGQIYSTILIAILTGKYLSQRNG